MFINRAGLWRIMEENKRRKAPIVGLSCFFSAQSSERVCGWSAHTAEETLRFPHSWFNPIKQVYFFVFNINSLFSSSVTCRKKIKGIWWNESLFVSNCNKEGVRESQRTELWEGRKRRNVGVGWDIKKIVSVWLMVLYGSLMSSDGQDDWQRVWPLVTAHHLCCPPQLTSHSARLPATVKWTTKNTIKPTD